MLEDLHWADEMSLRLLAFLSRRIRPWPVALVATAREEAVADTPVLYRVLQELDREEHGVRLVLPPLSRADTTVLVRTLARTGSDEAAISRLSDRAWTLSAGNPFVVVEMTRTLDQGTVPESDAALPLPVRVRDMIVEHLARLGERSRDLASVAAVVGREVEFSLLQRAAGLAEREAAESMEELVRRRVLHGVGEAFDFTHERIREVIYDQLLSPRRALLHASVARALESLYASTLDPHFAALGAHYRAGEVWDKAVHYLRRAGAPAVKRSAHREAVACFEQALAAHRHLPESRDTSEQAIDLLFDLRDSLEPLADLGRIQSVLREAESLATTVGDPRRLGRVFLYLTSHFRVTGDNDRAVESAGRALAIASESSNATLAAGVNAYLGAVHHARGDHRQALAALSTARTSFEDEESRQRFGLAFRPFVVWCSWLVTGRTTTRLP